MPGVTVRPGQLVRGLLTARVSAPPSGALTSDSVADSRLASSTSLTATPASTTTAPPSSVNAVVPAVVVTTGASGCAVTDTVFGAGALLLSPSLTTKLTVRFDVSGSWSVLL